MDMSSRHLSYEECKGRVNHRDCSDLVKNISMELRVTTHFVDKLWSRIVVDIFILTMEEEGTGRGGR